LKEKHDGIFLNDFEQINTLKALCFYW